MSTVTYLITNELILLKICPKMAAVLLAEASESSLFVKVDINWYPELLISRIKRINIEPCKARVKVSCS